MFTKTKQWRTAVIAGVVVLLFASFAYIGFIAGNEVHNTSSVCSGKASYSLFSIGLFSDLFVLRP